MANKKIAEFLEISKLWTNAVPEKDNTNDDAVKWKKNYWDNHHTIPIFKIDSHQLNPDGNGIKQKKRYKRLLPNLFLLSCNHFADTAADMVRKLHIKKSTNSFVDVTLPRSRLRFCLTWNGYRIDKHVSECIHRVIQMERVKEVKKRDTQGLPWRIIPNHSWKDIHSMTGLFNSLRGFSRTHTRSLYKSTIYRKGWMMETLSKLEEDEKNVKMNMSEKGWISFLSKCPWCENKLHAKGNRYHALLFCQHIQLLSYRNHLTVLLEQKLHALFNFVTETQNESEAHHFLQAIEKVLIRLHEIEEYDSEKHHLIYRTRTSWKKEEGYSTWKELLDSTTPIFGHIFGFNPVIENATLLDKDLNRAMCIPLGIIPKNVEKEITKLAKGLFNFELDINRRKTIIAGYWKKWNEIKEINIMRAIGLHRIVGNISNEYEKSFKEKYEMYEHTWKSIKRHLQNHHSGDNPTLAKKSKITAQSQDNFVRMKFCTGITCNRTHTRWAFTFAPNRIDSTKKQCHRCTKQQHALKKGAKILDTCIECLPLDKTDFLVRQLDNSTNEMNYKETLQCLDPIHISSTSVKHSPAKKRKGISDMQKGIIKTINTSITKMTNFNEEPMDRIKKAAAKLHKTVEKSNKFLKDDLQQNIAINNEIAKNKSHNQQRIANMGMKDNSIEKPRDSEEEKRIQIDVASALALNQWMYSFSIDRAIKNIRTQSPMNIYVANTGISAELRTWTPIKGWKIVARHFRSIEVINMKPNGIYIIPIFSGNANSGHWNTAVIWKKSDSCKGWMLDSLGVENISSEIAKTIKKIFSRARLRCRWQHVECRKQTEVECGPRSIVNMVSICDNIKKGDTVETAIEKATLMHISEENYVSSIIRRKAASWMRMGEEIQTRWIENERRLREYFRRNRQSTNLMLHHVHDTITIE